ncbi:ATP-dependent DNA helicase Mph1p [Trichomonascus vanleenenianus]|uniref:3'-5' DNA helicase n=1 Tax=Trichomonascus vanleenenianus TaxID=2268995 RepID=UPI003EC9F60B
MDSDSSDSDLNWDEVENLVEAERSSSAFSLNQPPSSSLPVVTKVFSSEPASSTPMDIVEISSAPKDAQEISSEEEDRSSEPAPRPRLVQTTINGERIVGEEQEMQKYEDPTPTHHELNPQALQTYIYPTNLSIRDYQFNIVQQALFRNVLCALPTGLGKTFIASTIMLNWYRWTKSAKIIFMAPTRPLVSQQVEACLSITGLPRHDTSVLISGGPITSKKRMAEWQTKRVIFATPQTVENDLRKGAIDPKEIVCLVVDEAHKAVGNYAYCKVVELIAQRNKSFRILALTATPSGYVEGVQEIIDNLKISKVEIRTEESIDIQKYMHKRKIERIRTEMLPIQREIMDLFCAAIDPLVKEMIGYKVLFNMDTQRISQFAMLSALKSYMQSPANRSGNKFLQFKVQAVMKILISAGQAMHLLKIYGIRPFYEKVNAMKEDATVDANGKSKKAGRTIARLLDDNNFVECLNRCESVLFKDGQPDIKFLGHEKLERLVEQLNLFFAEGFSSDMNSKVIVFAEYREPAAEITRVLSDRDLCPLVKPHLFVGQAGATGEGKGSGRNASGKSGMTQKEQQRVISEFKKGNINTLVATSIGEEGLDIGEVDLIVCYDQSKSPIRGLQRMGRTGRKRNGRIIMLMAENEEKKLELAMDGYRYIQGRVNGQHGNSTHQQFVYHLPDRIMPREIKVTCEKQEIVIPEENLEVLQDANGDADKAVRLLEEAQKKKKQAAPNKRKAVKASEKSPEFKRRHFMPENVETGFVTAGKLLNPGTPSTPKEDHNFGLSDSDFDDAALLSRPPTTPAVTTSTPSVAAKTPDTGELRQRYAFSSSEDEDDIDTTHATTVTDATRLTDDEITIEKEVKTPKTLNHDYLNDILDGPKTTPAPKQKATRKLAPKALAGEKGLLPLADEQTLVAKYGKLPEYQEYDPVQSARNDITTKFVPHSGVTSRLIELIKSSFK